MLPRQPAADRQHQHDGVLGHRDGIGAAVVADGHAGTPRRLDVHPVVAGAEQLDQLEFRGRLIEGVVHFHLAEADDVFGLRQRSLEFRAVGAGDDHVDPGRGELASDIHRAERVVHHDHLRGHRFPPVRLAGG